MAANRKEDTALLRGTIVGRVVTRGQMMAAHEAGYGVTPIPVLPVVVRDRNGLEHRLGLEITQLTRRTRGGITLCDFQGKVVRVLGTGGERLLDALVQGTIDLSCVLTVTDCQGRIECLRPVTAEAA